MTMKYAVRCDGLMEGASCGLVELTDEQYDAQMARPDSTWRCPRCGASAEWDDDTYEQHLECPDDESEETF
jgi:hypothetical protein